MSAYQLPTKQEIAAMRRYFSAKRYKVGELPKSLTRGHITSHDLELTTFILLRRVCDVTQTNLMRMNTWNYLLKIKAHIENEQATPHRPRPTYGRIRKRRNRTTRNLQK